MDTTEEVEFDYEAYTRENPPDLSKFRPGSEVRRERREAFRAKLINHVNMEIKHARRMKHVFISYCHENMTLVDWFCQKLMSHGIKVWLDRDELVPGIRWKQAIQQAIHQGDFFIACFSKEYSARDQTYMSEELSLAVERLREKPADKMWFIPVKLNECEVPDIDIGSGATLRDLQYINLYQDSDAAIQRLLEVISSESSQTMDGTATEGQEADECILFRSVEGQHYFIPFQKVRWDSTEIFLTLLPSSIEQATFLRSLRARLRSIPAGSSTDRLDVVAFAHQEDATWVKPQQIAQVSTSGKTVWEVILKEETVGSTYKHRTEKVIFEHLPLDQVAELRAKRILLDEKLKVATSTLTQATVFDQMLLEAQIRGELSSQYGNRLQALKSPIPELYRHFGKTPERFKKFARLISVLYLKLSNTVEDILQLDLELRNSMELQVKFRGRRSQSDVNEQPVFLEFEGNCSLPE